MFLIWRMRLARSSAKGSAGRVIFAREDQHGHSIMPLRSTVEAWCFIAEVVPVDLGGLDRPGMPLPERFGVVWLAAVEWMTDAAEISLTGTRNSIPRSAVTSWIWPQIT
jgi:hypothetical protein